MWQSSWQVWALVSAAFAALTAITAKIGVQNVDSNLATAIRTVVILLFAWAIAWKSNALNGLQVLAPRAWAIFGVVGFGNRCIVAVLFSRSATWPGFARGAGR